MTEEALHEIPLRYSLPMIKLDRDPGRAMVNIFAAEADRGEHYNDRQADCGDENWWGCEHRVGDKAHRAPGVLEGLEDAAVSGGMRSALLPGSCCS
ncbi:MAG TPA: hypothetical protein VK679_12780 [Gemmatimonadaceae bacterium]|nr:hypothetical protein [Gemmatimonadaceae bacterium]